MKQKIAIVDYGMGNLFSIYKRLIRLECDVFITSNNKVIENCDKIILPGVGHFAKAMKNLNTINLIPVLNEEVLIKKKPILGICLGMQLMASFSEEGNTTGLNWINAKVVKFTHTHSCYRTPHMGWNTITIKNESTLMKNITEEDEFYFVHSYHYTHTEKSVVLNETTYEYTFCSAIEKDNIFGVQYHPEKSHDSGDKLLKNFLTL